MQPAHCLNCEHPVIGQQKFCSSCGQKTAIHRLSLHDVGHDALHYFTHADKGIFSLIWQLLKRPGLVAREFVEGKRRKYFPPLNFFLIVAAIYVFSVSLLSQGNAGSAVPPAQWETVNRMPDGPQKKAVLQYYERSDKAMRFFNRYGNFVAMVATPFISLLMFLLYYKGRYNYTEHLVANMYNSGITVLVYSLIFLPLMKLFSVGRLNLLLFLFFVFEIAYRSVSYYHFINRRTGTAAVKAVFASIFVIVIWALVSFLMIFTYVSNGFWGLLD